MQITITISDDELQRVCEDKIRLIIAEYVGSYAYQNTIRDLVYKTVREKTADIIETKLSNRASIEALVTSEIERKIRLDIVRKLNKKDGE